MGAETRVFNPSGRPLPDDAPETHPKDAPERHGALTGSSKARIDWMLTIRKPSSVAKAFQAFDEHDRLKPSSYFDRVVDVMEELVTFTWLTRDISPYRVDRYRERKASAEALMQRVNLPKAV